MPVTGTPYLEIAELRDLMRDQLSSYDGEYTMALAAASDQVDHYCGRHFDRTETPSAKLLRPDHPCVLHVPDVADPGSVVLATDTGGQGTYSLAWTADQDYLIVTDRAIGGAWTKIDAVGSKTFPTCYRRPSVSLTAVWGWPEVPAAVKQATAILAVENFHAKDRHSVTATSSALRTDVGARNYGRRMMFDKIETTPVSDQVRALLDPFRVVALG